MTKSIEVHSVSLDVRVELRATRDDLLRWRLAAQKDDRTLAGWMRRTLNEETRKAGVVE
jgi:hypothetical protein